MTKKELMSLPHLSIAEEDRLVHLHSEEGYYICNVPEDIADYVYTDCLWLNIEDEYEEYATVTAEENRQNVERAEEAQKNRESFAEDIENILKEE